MPTPQWIVTIPPHNDRQGDRIFVYTRAGLRERKREAKAAGITLTVTPYKQIKD